MQKIIKDLRSLALLHTSVEYAHRPPRVHKGVAHELCDAHRLEEYYGFLVLVMGEEVVEIA
jgi:hypothetical protein